jgi:hypothetical protein
MVVGDAAQLRGAVPDGCDVSVGVGDVLAGGSAVVLVGGAADVVFGGVELAEGFGGVEHAGHAAAGVDLQEWVGDQVAGVSGAGQDPAGECVCGGGDAVAVMVRGGAADGFAVGEPAVVLGQGVEACEPIFVGVFVGEAGIA